MNEPDLVEIVQLGNIRVPIICPLLSPLIANALRKGWYEREERRAIEQAVHAGDRVLDLGGGLGVCSATAAVTASIHQLTIVEANPHLLDVIRLTLRLNNVENFELVWGAISTLPQKKTRLQVSEHYWAAREADGEVAGALEVPVVSPCPLLARVKPDVLICDIEGNERDLIDDADLSGIRSFIVEFHPKLYGMTVMETLDGKLHAGGLQRQTEWSFSESPQVHHYRRG